MIDFDDDTPGLEGDDDETAGKIAAGLNEVYTGSRLGGRTIAANIDTGEVGGETFSAGSRPPLRHPWHLFQIRPCSALDVQRRIDGLARHGAA